MKKLLLKTIETLNLFKFFNGYTKDTGTIFMLHRIDAQPVNGDECITPSLLAEYFNYLKRHKYKVISLSEYINALANHESTYKTVVFTVDDG
jgi:type IV secretory pathway component VirB8